MAPLALLFMLSGVAQVEARPTADTCEVSACKKPRKKKKRRSKKKEAPPPVVVPEPEPGPSAAELEAEAARVEAESKKLELEGRKTSKVTPGGASRWSNRGAMEPVMAEVPITAPLPERAIPVEAGVETPGQRLLAGDDQLSARLSLSIYHLETGGQDYVYDGDQRVEGVDRNIDLWRGRATLAYERIAGSDFGAHLDLEYRPRLNGPRFTDQRLNEAYVSWGLTDFRRPGGPDLGVAVGRVAVREAGYAQADGAAVRYRPIPELHLGAFGGVTGNPYGYNWAQRTTQIFSTGWYTGGAFASVRTDDLFVNVAGVLTYANVAVSAAGLDRIYAYVDAAYRVQPDLNVFVTGWLDMLPQGQLIQNVEAVVAYDPTRQLSLSLGLGRFSTVIYSLSNGYSYYLDPAGNTYDSANVPIVDEQGNPIAAFDSALQTAIYNQAKLRAGYSVSRELEVYATASTWLRDLSGSVGGGRNPGELDFSTFRLLPAAGVRFKDPDLIDAHAQATYVLDAQSNTKAILHAGVGRGLFGLYAGVDARLFLGDINGADGGVELTYTLPRDWFPGLLLVRGMFRYFRENVALGRPLGDDTRVVIPLQESFLGFAGVEWRL